MSKGEQPDPESTYSQPHTEAEKVDLETWRAHQSEHAAEEIAALVRREPMILIDEYGNATRGGKPVPGFSSSIPPKAEAALSLPYMDPRAVPSFDHSSEIAWVPELERFVSAEATTPYEPKPHLIKSDVSVEDVAQAVKRQLHPEGES
jgi:hypothetical protein